MSILVTGPRQPCVLVEIDEAVDHGLARQHLQLRIERGAHRKPALVKLLLAVILEDVAAHLLGEIFGGKDVRRSAGRTVDVKRLLLRLVAVGCRDEAVLDHAVDHVIAARDRLIAAAERIVVVRALGQRGEIGGLARSINSCTDLSKYSSEAAATP